MKIKISPFMRDVFTTGFTSITTILLLIFVTRLLAQGLGTKEFGAYSLARRIVSTIIPFTTLAMGVTLARHLGISMRDSEKRNAYLLGATGIVSILTLIIIIISFVLTSSISLWIFNSKGYEVLFRYSLLLIVGSSMYNVLYSYYRGLGQMNLANLWNLCVISSGMFVVAIIFANKRVAAKIIFWFSIVYLLSIPFLVYYNIKALKQIKNPKKIKTAVKELIRYGWLRTPGGLAFAGLLTIGPILAPRFGSLKDSGYLVIGQSLFRIMESAIVAFGLVALPKIAQLYADNKEQFLRERIIDLLIFIFQIGLFATLHLYLWADLIVQIWLGIDFLEAVPLIRIIILALIPYLSYVILRSVIDAVEVRAINTINLFIALVLASLMAFILGSTQLRSMGLALGTMGGFWILGLMTVRYLKNSYHIRIEKNLVAKTLLINISLFFLAFFLRWSLRGITLYFTKLAIAVLIESILLMIYLIFLLNWKVSWIEEIKKRILIIK